MADDRPEQPGKEPATSRMLNGLAVFGQLTVVVLVGIGYLLLSSRYGLLIRLFAVLMGILLLIVAWAYWGSLLLAIAGWLGLPVGPSEAPTPLEGAVQVVVTVVSLGSFVVASIFAVRWVRQRVIPWLKELISLHER